MKSKILINAVDHDECRIAKVIDTKLEEFHIESTTREITYGNIYKGVITRIEPSLQAVFVDYGAERNGFLQKHEIHSDYYLDPPSGDRSIKSLVKRGQEVLVQVTKEPIMKKGAMLTTHISLPGRFSVLIPGNDTRGVSRKIEDEKERKRLKEVLKGLKIPDGFGLIVRTAGKNRTKTVINRDIRYLMRLWKTIKENVMKAETPALMYKERDLIVRSLRDYFTPEVEEILIDEPVAHREALKFMNIISPKQTKMVKLYKGVKPIFTKFQLEEQIESIYNSQVKLKSGGSIVIQQTEALVSIDVNSGKATREESIELTALNTNLEAAEEIARQLRLRDLGGLIVLDFIDMRETKHKREVERALKNHMKRDKARSKVGKISQFGIVEMSRQRIRPPIEYTSFVACPTCRGRGQVPSVESIGIGFLRRLSLESLKGNVAGLKGYVTPEVAQYILNRKRKELVDLETRRDLVITIEGDPELRPGESRIIPS